MVLTAVRKSVCSAHSSARKTRVLAASAGFDLGFGIGGGAPISLESNTLPALVYAVHEIRGEDYGYR